MTIGIALCTYNGEKYLSQQLESIINQTIKPDIIYVNDDNSTDNTLDILDKYAKEAKITFDIQVNKENLGYISNFENVISRCETEIILPSDQDDIWLQKKIEELCAPFEDDAVMLSFGNSELVDDELKSMGRTLFDQILFPKSKRKRAQKGKLFEIMVEHNVISGHCMAFRRTLLDYALPFNRNFQWDYWLGIIAVSSFKYAIIDKVFVNYRIHDTNVVGSFEKTYLSIRWLSMINMWIRYKLGMKVSSPLPTMDRQNLNEHRKQQQLEIEEELTSRGLGNDFSFKVLNEKMFHLEVRKNLNKYRILRIPTICKELISGRYFKYSRGLLSAFIDMFRN